MGKFELDSEKKDLQDRLDTTIQGLLEAHEEDIKEILNSSSNNLNLLFSKYVFVDFKVVFNNYNKIGQIGFILAIDKLVSEKVNPTYKLILGFEFSVPKDKPQELLVDNPNLPILMSCKNLHNNKTIMLKRFYFKLKLLGVRSWKIRKYSIEDIKKFLMLEIIKTLNETLLKNDNFEFHYRQHLWAGRIKK